MHHNGLVACSKQEQARALTLTLMFVQSLRDSAAHTATGASRHNFDPAKQIPVADVTLTSDLNPVPTPSTITAIPQPLTLRRATMIVIGKVTDSTARILLEMNHHTEVTMRLRCTKRDFRDLSNKKSEDKGRTEASM